MSLPEQTMPDFSSPSSHPLPLCSCCSWQLPAHTLLTVALNPSRVVNTPRVVFSSLAQVCTPSAQNYAGHYHSEMRGGDRAIRAVCHLKSTVSAVEKPRNACVKDMLRVTLSTQHPPCCSWHLALQRTESSQAVSFLRLHGYKSVASAVPLRHKAGFSDWKLRHSIPRPWEK